MKKIVFRSILILVISIHCFTARAGFGVGTLYGKVTCSVSGNGIASAELTFLSENNPVTHIVFPDGYYTADVLSGHGYTIVVTADGYYPQTITDFDVIADGFHQLEVELNPLLPIIESVEPRIIRKRYGFIADSIQLTIRGRRLDLLRGTDRNWAQHGVHVHIVNTVDETDDGFYPSIGWNRYMYFSPTEISNTLIKGYIKKTSQQVLYGQYLLFIYSSPPDSWVSIYQSIGSNQFAFQVLPPFDKSIAKKNYAVYLFNPPNDLYPRPTKVSRKSYLKKTNYLPSKTPPPVVQFNPPKIEYLKSKIADPTKKPKEWTVGSERTIRWSNFNIPKAIRKYIKIRIEIVYNDDVIGIIAKDQPIGIKKYNWRVGQFEGEDLKENHLYRVRLSSSQGMICKEFPIKFMK